MLPEREDVLSLETAYLAEELAAVRGHRAPRISPSQAEELEVDLGLPRLSSGPPPAEPPLADGQPGPSLIAKGAQGDRPRLWARWQGNRTHVGTALVLAALTAGWAVGAGLEREHVWIRTAFFSILLGVPGCAGLRRELRGGCQAVCPERRGIAAACVGRPASNRAL